MTQLKNKFKGHLFTIRIRYDSNSSEQSNCYCMLTILVYFYLKNTPDIEIALSADLLTESQWLIDNKLSLHDKASGKTESIHVWFKT